MNKGLKIAATAAAVLALAACGSDGDGNLFGFTGNGDGGQVAPGGNNNSVQPDVSSQRANLALFGIDPALISEVSLDGTNNGRSALTADSGGAGQTNYAGFGLDVGAANNFAAAARVFRPRQMTNQESEQDTRRIADQLLEDARMELEGQGNVDRFDVLVNRISSNAQATVVNLTVDLELSGAQSVADLRNVLLQSFASSPINAPADASATSAAFRITLAVWVVNGRIICWSGVFRSEDADPVNTAFGDLNRGTSVTDASSITTAAGQDSFQQTMGNNQTDIVWVIDNSGSMSQEQQNLADGATNFFNLLSNAGLDYNLGVARTERQTGLGECWELSTLTDGTSRFITPNTPDDLVEWQTISRPGTPGGTETGLFCGQQVFEDPTGTNTGFDRASAPNVVVFVSDEPDRESYSNDTPRNPPPGGNYMNQDLAFYLDYYTNVNPVTAFAIVGTGSEIRLTFNNVEPGGQDLDFDCNGEGGNADGGANYAEVVSRTGGSRSSICSNASTFDTMFDEIVTVATGRASNFQLMETPIASTVLVEVDGTPVVRDPSGQDGFDVLFSATGAAVAFFGPAIPQSGQTIAISYDFISN